MTTFKDHFSGQAADYARFRPHYPETLFAFLASLPDQRRLAWDCATGNGQAAVDLARYFDQVIATDASAAQVASAVPAPGVTYRVAPAEASGITDSTVDLVVVAQALHWFDIPAFFREATRVLRPGGVLAVSSYKFVTIAPEVDQLVNHFYSETVGAYWPPERRMVEQGYDHLIFPFAEIQAPAFAMTSSWRLADLVGYLGTWSATQRFIKDRGFDPLPELASALRAVWDDPDRPRPASWPLTLRAGRR